MSLTGFVDVHSHVVPSGDDGAVSIAEALELCGRAAADGTRVLFATPHMHAPWDSYPWTPQRARRYDETFPAVRDGAAALGLELRRGREVFPTEVLTGDPGALCLEGTSAVLVEFPGSWVDLPNQLGLVDDAALHIEAHGLTPVLAHPERCSEVWRDPLALRKWVDRGRLLCANAPSFVGGHGRHAETVVWQLAEADLLALVASDGHRAPRPPVLSAASRAVRDRLGDGAARRLFDGSALPWTRPPASVTRAEPT